MSLKKALLVFDPFRRPEQRSYVSARTDILLEVGDRAWVAITDEQAERYAEQGIAVQFRQAVDWIELPAVVFNPGIQEAVAPPALQRAAPTGDATDYHLVQFVTPPVSDWIGQIAELGGEGIQSVSEASLVFRLTSAQEVEVAALPFVRWVGRFHPAYALGFQLAGQGRPFEALELNTIAVDPGSLPESPADQPNLTITFFDDILPADQRAAVEGTGAAVHLETARGFLLRASAGMVDGLLAIPGLFSIETFAPPTTTNDRGRAILNTPAVSRFGNIGFQVNLEGAGEIVGVLDLGLDHGNPDNLSTLHSDIQGRVVRLIHHTNPNAPPTPPAAQVPDRGVFVINGQNVPYDHGTHVTGTIAGNGAGTSGQLKGMAPTAHIVFQGPLNGPYIQVFRLAHRLGARVHNNSWGSPALNLTPPPVTPPTNNRYFNNIAGNIDEFCFLNPDSLVVFASGNDEEDTTGVADGILDANRLKYEATAKNILAVGASESFRKDTGNSLDYRQSFRNSQRNPLLQHQAFDTLAGGMIADNPDQMALFSSRGQVNTAAAAPVATGRIRPDLVAPGTNILSLRSRLVPPTPTDMTSYPSGVDKNFYDFASGTSMAAPHVSGAAALVRQFYRQRFGRLRELTLLEGVTRSATPPPDFVDSPSIAPHADGVIFVWVTPAADSAQKRIVASVHARDLSRLHPNPIVLRDNAGDNPMPRVARHGAHALLLHRHSNGELQLSRYQKDAPPNYNLSLDGGFDSDGTLVADTGVDSSAERPPGLVVVGDDAALIWSVGAGTALRWRRFSAIDGTARDAGPVELGGVATTSPHPFLIHNGTRYAAVWAHRNGDTRSVRFAIAGADGSLTDSAPQNVTAGGFDIYDPHLAWNARADKFAVVWCERHATGNVIALRFMNPDSTQAATHTVPVSVPSETEVRRPYIATHPRQGFILAWEDNRQGGQFAVHLALLGENGQIDQRIEPNPLDPGNRRLLRISDTVQDTQGLAALADDSGIIVAWQSLEEARRDRLDVSATQVTLEGAFRSSVDPRKPLIVCGKYRPNRMSQLNNTALDGVSMAWVGGDYYYLRWESEDEPLAIPQLALVRTDAGGRADASYGNNGRRNLSSNLFDRSLEMHWTGTQLACVTSGVGFLSLLRVDLFDAAGDGLDGSKPGTVAFGANGSRPFNELAHGDVSPQLADIALAPPDFGIIVVYGTGFPFAKSLRYAILNRRGQFVDGDGNAMGGGGNPIAPIDLFSHPNANGTIGTARHGWFHFNQTDGRNSIAIWHQRDTPAARFDVFMRRFDRHGAGLGAAPVPLLARAAGDMFDARNAVVEPRPVSISTAAQSNRREYAVAWQHRNAAADPWEIRFSRLQRAGTVVANPAAPTPANPNQSNIRVVFPGMADAGGAQVWPPDAATPMHALEPQLACTYSDAPWRPLPGAAAALGPMRNEWAPGYGLAWIGQAVAGANRPRTLYFMVINENGSPIQLDPLPVPAAPPNAPTLTNHTSVPVQISKAGADARDFKLVWNGRVFHLAWTEAEGSTLRHMRTAITRNGHLDAYAQPSSALLRATLINGATNINNTSLPNIPTPPITNANRNHGYGWGRVNMRQSVAASGPVTFYACDDGAVGPGRTARYRFAIPPGTALLRATLVWTDPPGANRIHNLNLRIRANGQEFHGNTWQAAANHQHESRAVAAAAPFDSNHTIEQIVIPNPPAGEYDVEVVGQTVTAHRFFPFPAQPFALVFMGSGPEVRYQRDVECVLPFH